MDCELKYLSIALNYVEEVIVVGIVSVSDKFFVRMKRLRNGANLHNVWHDVHIL